MDIGTPAAGNSLVDSSYRVRSNGSGRYRIINISPGSWNIGAELAGYSRQMKAVNLDSGQNERVDFELTPVPTISLIARNSKGNIIFAHAGCQDSTTIDENGVITISVPGNAGPARCVISVEGYKAREISIDPNAPPADVVLDEADLFTGRVHTLSGDPVPGVSIGFSESSVGAVTDSSDNFKIQMEGPVLMVTTSKPGFISELLYFIDNKLPDSLDIPLPPVEGGIYGKVVDETGAPVTRFTLALREAGADRYPRLGKYVDSESGMFSVTEVPAGTYQMVIYAFTDRINQVRKTASMQVEIRKGFYFGELQVKLSSPQTQTPR